MSKAEPNIRQRISFMGIAQFFNAIVNILMVPYLARVLPKEEYGSYGQVLLIITVSQVVLSFGLSKLIYVTLSDPKKKNEDAVINNLSGSMLLAVFGIALLLLGTEILAGFFNNERLVDLLRIYAFALAFNLLAESFNSILNFLKKVKQMALISSITNSMRVGLIFVAIQFYESLELVFYFLLVVSILNAAILFRALPKGLMKGKVNFSEIFAQLKLGLPLSLSGITTTLMVQTDGIMVSRMLDTSSYAVYRMGAIPVPFLFIIYTSVITVTLPEITRYFHQNKIAALLQLKRKSSLSLAVINYPILIFVLIFSKELLDVYLGERYADSRWVFVIYNLLLFMRINDYLDVLIAKTKTSLILKVDLSIFFLNIILNYLFIKAFGIEGAAAASIISYLLLFSLYSRAAAKVMAVKVHEFFAFRKTFMVFLISTALAALSYLLYQLVDGIVWVLVLAGIYYFVTNLVLIKSKLIPLEQIKETVAQVKLLSPLSKLLNRLG